MQSCITSTLATCYLQFQSLPPLLALLSCTSFHDPCLPVFFPLNYFDPANRTRSQTQHDSKGGFVHNGDFETGVLGGWQCTGSQCNVVASEDGGHHLQVEARGSEFSGPWQLLDPLPGSDQLNLNLRFSIKARWVKRIVVISGFLCLQQRLIGKMESTGHQRRRH